METIKRTCRKCNQTKELTPFNFYREGGGFENHCKVCVAARKGVKNINVVHDKEETKARALQKRKDNVITCECHAVIRKDNQKRHYSSCQHQNYLRKLKEEAEKPFWIK